MKDDTSVDTTSSASTSMLSLSAPEPPLEGEPAAAGFGAAPPLAAASGDALAEALPEAVPAPVGGEVVPRGKKNDATDGGDDLFDAGAGAAPLPGASVAGLDRAGVAAAAVVPLAAEDKTPEEVVLLAPVKKAAIRSSELGAGAGASAAASTVDGVAGAPAAAGVPTLTEPAPTAEAAAAPSTACASASALALALASRRACLRTYLGGACTTVGSGQ